MIYNPFTVNNMAENEGAGWPGGRVGGAALKYPVGEGECVRSGNPDDRDAAFSRRGGDGRYGVIRVQGSMSVVRFINRDT